MTPFVPDGEETPLARWRAARLAVAAEEVGRLGHDLRGILSPALLAAERLEGNADAQVRRAGEVMVRAVERAAAAVAEAMGSLHASVGVPRVPVPVRDAVGCAVPEGFLLDNRIGADLVATLEAVHLAEVVRCLLAEAAAHGASAAVASVTLPPRQLVLEFVYDRASDRPAPTPGCDSVIADMLARAMGGTLARALAERQARATLTVRRF